MIVLHGSWCKQNTGRYGGRLYLWAETAVEESGRRRRAGVSASRARLHPGQVSARQVRLACQRLAPEASLPRTSSGAVVWLPSSEGRPWPAPELLAAGGEGSEDPSLGAWQVEGVTVTAEQALPLLVRLPERLEGALPEVALGADLRYWRQVAKLALELLARQRYLPAVATDGAERPLAAWEPCLEDPGDVERFRRLSAAMPPACRAVRLRSEGRRRASVSPAGLSTSAELLDSFLATTVDASVRRWGRSASGQRAAGTAPAGQWRRRLLERPSGGMLPAITGSPRRTDAFVAQYRQWARQPEVPGDGGFRICLRLEAPELPPDDSPADRANPDSWTLRYFLQATDDPSLLVPAETVWREAGSTLRYLSRRFEAPQERLLAGLGRASRTFAPLERSLQTACPAACELDTTEAYAFLREAAPVLESAGFGLLVPPWWRKPAARLGLRLQVSSGAGPGSGMLGLDSLVDYDWLLALGDETLSWEEFRRLAELKVPLVQVRGQWVELRPEQVQNVLRFWEERRRKAQGTLGEALHLAQTADGDGREAQLPVVEVRADGWAGELLGQLAGREAFSPVPAPESFIGELRPYQVTGLSWLAFLQRWGLGACLADDMGLGKTIQVLALLLRNREMGRSLGPALLICPTSAVGNWQREAERFAPDLRLLVHYGHERQSGEELAAEAARHDLVLSTYSLLYRDEESLAAVPWDGIILDEAQNIKNPGTRQAQAARRLPASYRIALTGTPVENRLGDLWSIVDFLNPGYLGGQADFRRRFAIPIERYRNPDMLRRLRGLVRPFLLRRVKSDPAIIRDLPEKLELPVYYQLSREQGTLYEAVVRDAMTQIEDSEGIQRRGLVLSMLLRLKQICNHPALFLGDGSALEGRSGKLARLSEMLEEVAAEGDHALVFTQFAEMGHMLRRHLQSELHQEVLFLHGAVPQKQRERMIRRFQDDPQAPAVFILSLRAGGTALNLTRANHVFHFDRWWNPAVEDQATDRAFRIGQTRNVLVHKFICLGTLEERIAELIESKKALAENVVESGEDWLTEMSTEQLRELLVLGQEAVAE